MCSIGGWEESVDEHYFVNISGVPKTFAHLLRFPATCWRAIAIPHAKKLFFKNKLNAVFVITIPRFYRSTNYPVEILTNPLKILNSLR